jgi:hypothetical protein
MKKNWIHNFHCRGCGSSLGRYEDNPDSGYREPVCFVCCAGQFELKESEIEGEDFPEILKLTGREWGHVSQILPRLNTPGQIMSAIEMNPLYSYETASDLLTRKLVHEDLAGLSPGLITAIEKMAQGNILRKKKNAKTGKPKKL